MGGKAHRGLDDTPLYRFLLSRVGSEWDEVYREAVARLDRPDPIFHVVAREDDERREMVRTGESSFFSGMYVDAAGILQLVNPALRAEELEPSCTCCTHTLNGVRFGLPAPAWLRGEDASAGAGAGDGDGDAGDTRATDPSEEVEGED